MMRILRKGERYVLYKPKEKNYFLSSYIRQCMLLLTGLFCFHFVCFAQSSRLGGTTGKTLTGKVTSAVDGQPIQGATISVGERYTITDDKGEFSIRVENNSGTLKVQHIGYQEQSISYNHDTGYILVSLNIAESEIEEVEVISTGYQQLPKERATGSFVQIDNEMLNRRVSTNIIGRLDGVVAGLQFDSRSGESLLNIRGINTLNPTIAQPLIVLDNFPYLGDLSAINPDDIESVTLLKDAAATSIWGSRAGNGVIVISTKKSSLDRPLALNFSTNIRLAEKEKLFYTPAMSSTDFMEVERFLFEKGHYEAFLNNDFSRFYVVSPLVDLLNQINKGDEDRSMLEDKMAIWAKQDYREDMLDHVYRKPLLQQYQFNASGGNDKIGFQTSLSYDRQLENRYGNSANRLNFSLDNLVALTEGLTANVKVQYSKQWGRVGGLPQYPINPGGQKNSLYPYAKLFEGGQPLVIPYGFNQRYIDGLEDSGLLDWSYSPLSEKDAAYSNNDVQRLLSAISLKYTFLPGISLNATYQYDMQLDGRNLNQTVASFYTRNLINLYTTEINGELRQHIPYGDIFTKNSSTTMGHRGRMQLNTDRSIGTDLNLSLIAGGELSHVGLVGETTRLYGFNEEVWTKRIIDYNTFIPMYDGLGQSQQIPYMDGISGTVNRTVSVFANMSLAYRERYTLSASARQDAANLYGVKANQRWNPLWSVGGKWAVIRQSDKLPIIDHLAMRATYGHGGNMMQVGNHRATIVKMDNAAYTALPYARIIEAANPELKWEDVRTMNFGIEFQLLQRKLYGAVEFFDKKSTDLITRVPLDATTGMLNALRNVGAMKGRGVDIQLGSSLKMGEHQVNINGNFSMVRDRVTAYFTDPLQSQYVVVNGGQTFMTILDKPTYPVYSFRFEGLDEVNGNPLGRLDNDISTSYTDLINAPIEELEYHGQALPPKYGNVAVQYRWKGFGVYLNFGFKYGHVLKKETIEYHRLFEKWEGHRDYSKRWQQPGDEKWTSVPSMIYPAVENRDFFYANSAANIIRGDLVRLQDIRLSKDFVLGRESNRQKRVAAYLNVQHVGLIWTANNEGIDPDFNRLPTPRAYVFGITYNL